MNALAPFNPHLYRLNIPSMESLIIVVKVVVTVRVFLFPRHLLVLHSLRHNISKQNREISMSMEIKEKDYF